MQLCSDQPPPIPRRTANYPPSLWDDFCIQSLPDSSLNAAQVDRWEKLKEDVRQSIHDEKNDIIELLDLIDGLCQIGVSYHFESEIKNMLLRVGSSFEILSNILKNNLHGCALLFRLLREHGINVPNLSVDVLLGGFKNESGGFKHNIASDIKGMLSLYEASYLAGEGEKELDEAFEFASKHLTNYLKEPLFVNLQLHEQVNHAMELPLHWRIPRLHMRWFIDAYERQDKMNPELLEFAKLDFNMVQSLHKKELKEMSRWWRNLGLDGDAFNFARDRLMEIYLFSLECTFEPRFWRCRKMMTKISCIVTIIDDIYDIYGLLDELELFTEAIDEWKITTQKLPNYMERTLTALFNTMDDIACTISMEKGLDILPHLKQAWRDICKSYLVEARWYYAGYTPTLNEYFENAWVTVTIPLLLTSAHCASEELTEDALNSFEFYPEVARHSSMLTRLYDDLGTSMDELQRGDVPKSIQCHMNESKVSESVARDHIKRLIKKHWKLMNTEHIVASNFEDSFKRYVLNLPRMTHFLYQHGDGYGKPSHETRDMIISLLIKPIPL
ncbi:hypothetical protein KSP39_PZI015403 [Platanthera zijinensis]|uniref:Uncharacterized protein n=1 Tax=Platanthera zijinensis TaxID=2320716 RepID=A0AAP0G220_9ASPA